MTAVVAANAARVHEVAENSRQLLCDCQQGDVGVADGRSKDLPRTDTLSLRHCQVAP